MFIKYNRKRRIKDDFSLTSASSRMELQFTEMEKTAGRADLLQDKGCSMGHAKFKMPGRHLSETSSG